MKLKKFGPGVRPKCYYVDPPLVNEPLNLDVCLRFTSLQSTVSLKGEHTSHSIIPGILSLHFRSDFLKTPLQAPTPPLYSST